MRTVQEVIRSISKKDLLFEFVKIDRPQIRLFDSEKDIRNIPYRNIKHNYKQNFFECVDILRRMKIKEPRDGRKCIIFGYPSLNEYGPMGIRHDIIYADELMEHGEKTLGYSYIISDWDEVLGFFVAETKYTRENIEKIAAQIIYELTFHGYTPDGVKKWRAELEESIAEMERDNPPEERESEYDPYKEAERWDRITSPRENLSEEERLEKTYREAADAYADYLRGKEIRELIELVTGDENFVPGNGSVNRKPPKKTRNG